LSANLKHSPPPYDRDSNEPVDSETSKVILLILEFALDMAKDTQELKQWFDYNSKEVFRLHTEDKDTLREKYKAKAEQLRRNKNGVRQHEHRNTVAEHQKTV